MRPERYHRLRSVLDRRQPDLTVLMERVNKTHNFSAILRSCDAVGVLEAHAVLPDRKVPIHHDTSGGAGKWIGVETHPDPASAIRHLTGEGFQVVAADPDADAIDYREGEFTRPTAFLVGAELFGIAPESLEAAHLRVAIPLEGMVRSLNVSVATALLLFEARRQREAAGMYEVCRLPVDRYREILFEWCHPQVARRLRAQGRPYPPLGRDGEILREE